MLRRYVLSFFLLFSAEELLVGFGWVVGVDELHTHNM